MSSDQYNWSAKRPTLLGFAALAFLILGIGVWSVKANITGAIVASGLVRSETNRQVVQHPEGGVIKEILVDDGDLVAAGDILLRFDDKFLRSDLTVASEQLFEIMARKARLQAERDGSDEIKFGADIMAASDNPIITELMEGQLSLFEARRDSLEREAALLFERTAQIEEQIIGAEAQVQALRLQRDLIVEEMVDETILLEKGLSQATTVKALKREAVRLEGFTAELLAIIAEKRGQITEIEIEVLRLRSWLREEAITSLRNLRYREIELRESVKSLTEVLQRMNVRAPSSGIIYGKQFHALRSVVRPAETILSIVPQNKPLVIVAKIPVIHIDQVHIDQEVSLRFSAFDMRSTPVILGRVIKISADVFDDEVIGETYYSAEIIFPIEEADRLDGLGILPGMPVEVFLKTTDRTPLEYLLKPLTGYFYKAFR